MSIFTTKVVGSTYKNPDGLNRQQIIKMCKAGERIKLIREPNNPRDVFAIGVFRESGEQIGYLAKHVATDNELPYHMDRGGQVYATVSKIIAERSGLQRAKKTYYCIIELVKGPVLLFPTGEKNDPEFGRNLYMYSGIERQRGMDRRSGMDRRQ
jgi:hypothetical protein